MEPWETTLIWVVVVLVLGGALIVVLKRHLDSQVRLETRRQVERERDGEIDRREREHELTIRQDPSVVQAEAAVEAAAARTRAAKITAKGALAAARHQYRLEAEARDRRSEHRHEVAHSAWSAVTAPFRSIGRRRQVVLSGSDVAFEAYTKAVKEGLRMSFSDWMGGYQIVDGDIVPR